MEDNYKERINSSLIYIENNLFSEITLDDVAQSAFMSPYHFHRVFQIKMGDSLMEYIKRRRFSEIVPEIYEGETRILDIAIRCGFNSHEAFTRSFKEFYNITPKKLRETMKKLPTYPSMVDRINWIDKMPVELDEPRVEYCETRTIVGVKQSIEINGYGIVKKILKTWKGFNRSIKKYTDLKGVDALGISIIDSDSTFSDGNYFTYFAGVDKNFLEQYPPELDHIVLESSKYLVFTYKGPTKRLRDAHDYIYTHWLPGHNITLTGNYSFEYYSCKSRLNQRNSNIEIWIPCTLTTSLS